MRKVLLVHISGHSGCCNTLVTMLNNGDFGFPYCATPAFSTPAVWCRVFHSRVFQSRVFNRPLSCKIVRKSFDNIKHTERSPTIRISLFYYNAIYLLSTYVHIPIQIQ